MILKIDLPGQVTLDVFVRGIIQNQMKTSSAGMDIYSDPFKGTKRIGHLVDFKTSVLTLPISIEYNEP